MHTSAGQIGTGLRAVTPDGWEANPGPVLAKSNRSLSLGFMITGVRTNAPRTIAPLGKVPSRTNAPTRLTGSFTHLRTDILSVTKCCDAPET